MLAHLWENISIKALLCCRPFTYYVDRCMNRWCYYSLSCTCRKCMTWIVKESAVTEHNILIRRISAKGRTRNNFSCYYILSSSCNEQHEKWQERESWCWSCERKCNFMSEFYFSTATCFITNFNRVLQLSTDLCRGNLKGWDNLCSDQRGENETIAYK